MFIIQQWFKYDCGGRCLGKQLVGVNTTTFEN